MPKNDLRGCIAETAYIFNLSADGTNDHADVALPLAVKCVLNHSTFSLPINKPDFSLSPL
jgi:hypothetical protein